jgi:hypothetical protein
MTHKDTIEKLRFELKKLRKENIEQNYLLHTICRERDEAWKAFAEIMILIDKALGDKKLEFLNQVLRKQVKK